MLCILNDIISAGALRQGMLDAIIRLVDNIKSENS